MSSNGNFQRSGSGASRGSARGGGGGFTGPPPANGMPWMYPAYPAVYAYPMPMGMAPYPYPMQPQAYPPPMAQLPPMIFGIDVECVATGKTHNDRSVAQFALVDESERTVLNVYVKPDTEVVSYLTPISGITQEQLEKQGIPLQNAMALLKMHLPPNAILVGQNVRKDVEWLGLREGIDFGELIDLAGLYRIWNERYKTYSVFSQDHLARVLLGQDLGAHIAHDAAGDALKSMKLYKLHREAKPKPDAWGEIERKLLGAPASPSFAKLNPTHEGVCMGNRKSCTCGAPFFG